MTKDKPYIRYFHTGPFPIYVGFTINPAAFAKEMARLKVDRLPPFTIGGAPGTMHIVTKEGVMRTCIVCIKMRKGVTPGEVSGLLVHEAVHCFQQTKEAMGEDEPSCEFEAYTIGYYAQSFIEELARIKKAKRSPK